MEDGRNRLPFTLVKEQWGEIRHISEECPGVFYLATVMEDSDVCREMYAVTTDAVPSIVSEEAIAYGKRAGNIYVFEYEVDDNGWEIIDYEILRYKVKNHIEIAETESLYSAALYSADRYPEYFGGHIPPRCTPWGLTVRYKKAAEGVFFLETDRCEWLLAVANPIWETELSEAAQAMGTFCAMDEKMLEREAGYLYFKRDRCAPAIYELLDFESYDGLMKFIASRDALETHVHKQSMEYVLWHNAMQLMGAGKCDILSNILLALGYEDADVDGPSKELRERRVAACLHYSPDLVNTELLRLPK